MNVSARNKLATRKKWLTFITHVIVITLLFILPELMHNYNRPWGTIPLIAIYLKAAIFVCVFYVNYYFILDRTLLGKRRRVWKFIGSNLALLLTGVVLIYLVQHFVIGWGLPQKLDQVPREGEIPPGFDTFSLLVRYSSFFVRDAGILMLTIALSVALKLGENWTDMEAKHQKMLTTQKSEELASLKNQLNPHFLFNTLNTIYALIAVSPDQAQEAVHQLSTQLRYVLYENPKRVSLSREVDFVKSYISLMEMRLGDGIVEAKYPDAEKAANVEVPPLIFITLIENAFKHGNTGVKDQPIKIDISVNGQGDVSCLTSNHFIPKPATSEKGGIGIANLKRRLQLIYGKNASLSTEIKGDTYTALLTINHS